MLLKEQYRISTPGQAMRGGKPGQAAANDNDIVFCPVTANGVYGSVSSSYDARWYLMMLAVDGAFSE